MTAFRWKSLITLLFTCLLGTQIFAAPGPIGSMAPTGSLNTQRHRHTATLLPNGQVLIAGGYDGTNVLNSAELYNPVTRVFTPTGNMNVPRRYHTATLLPDGTVLIAGGGDGVELSVVKSAEIYNPATGIFTATNDMVVERRHHTATLLNDGTVLIAGGYGPTTLLTAEIYNPTAHTFTATTGPMARARDQHTATLLADGTVLMVGGWNSQDKNYSPIAEIFDPTSGTFSDTDTLANQRYVHTATLLPTSGLVLIVGGFGAGLYPLAAELYDLDDGTFSASANLTAKRDWHTATLLPNGMVLVAGGNNKNDKSGPISVSELFDPNTATFLSAADLNTARFWHTATLMHNGKVLLTGGSTDGSDALASAELYDPQDPAPAGLSYASNPVTYHASTTIAPNIPSSTGGAIASYTIYPNLPAGLTLDPTTGIISGTPTKGKVSTTYTVTAYNATGTTTVSLVLDVEGITVQPQNVTGNENQSKAISVVALGATAYQWQRSDNGGAAWYDVVNGTGGTTADYVTPALTPADNGAMFRVVVTCPTGTQTSDAALLTVNYITITAQMPTNTFVNLGGTATLSVTAVGNPAGLSYQWYKQPYGQVAAAISEANSTTYDLPAVTQADHLALFYVTITNGAITKTSTATHLQVRNPYIVVQPADTTVAGSTAATFSVTAAGDAVITYQWYRSTDGGTTWTGIAGAKASTYVTPPTIPANSGTMYYVNIRNSYGSINSNPATLTVGAWTGMPTITSQPSNATVIQGATATFSVTATGYTPLSYQWRKNTLPIALANSSTYTIPPATLGDDGATFDVVVTDTYGGERTSNAATLTVRHGLITTTGSMFVSRRYHTATRLADGKVLIVGGFSGSSTLASAEIYDPGTGTFSATTGSLTTARYYHTATLLNDGKVLIAGGTTTGSNAITSLEVYDPTTGLFTSGGTMKRPRRMHTATLLPISGNVLFAAGSSYPTTAEVYNPTTKVSTATTGSLSTGRYSHTATYLPASGKVLIVGGYSSSSRTAVSVAELFDPGTTTFSNTGSLTTARYVHTATLLNDGRVLIAGGFNSGYPVACEVYDPTLGGGTFVPTGSLTAGRDYVDATLLSSGKVLLSGGWKGSALSSSELYDPTVGGGTWTPTGSLNTARGYHTSTLLLDGTVLLVGGYNGGYLNTAEIYDPQP